MNIKFPLSNFPAMLREEFRGYTLSIFQKDLLAGLTVAAVALPLALAFGIASGADAAAGLVTAILSGLIIGGLSGGSFQVSGPTGAMSAVLIVVASRFGLQGMWVTGLIAGLIVLVVGVFKLGRVISFIPSNVITGFTSGIAIIIFVGQIDNFLGVKTHVAEGAFGGLLAPESALAKLFNYFSGGFQPNLQTMLIAGIVIATMFLLPKSVTRRVPGSLIGLVLATVVAVALNFNVPVIGEIPRTIILDQRLSLAALGQVNIGALITPALSVAALGAIESLLCGAVCSKATGRPMDGDQELIAQGIGNIIIPFFGGVPATAAIARSSVGIASGGRTRVVSFVHSAILLLSAFALAPLISRVPLAALAGVLMVTAIRMNEWSEIRWMFTHGFKSAIAAFAITMIATAALDLTQAIVIGVALSAIMFISRISAIAIAVKNVDVNMLKERGHDMSAADPEVKVAYVTGPMFFAATAAFRNAFSGDLPKHALILSMRGVPALDTSGLELIEEIYGRMRKQGGQLFMAAVQPAVKGMLDRAGLTHEIGPDHFFWSADQAIVEAHKNYRVDRSDNEFEN